MAVVALVCGNTSFDVRYRELAERDEVRERIEVHHVPAPGRTEIDPLLAALDGRRLAVCGTDADLAAVVLRLLRTERLEEVPVAYLPARDDSAAADLWGLPTDPARALDLALRGEPDRVPLVRDDAGGVLVGLGVLAPVRGVAYCDDEQVLRGQASSLEVTPDPSGGAGGVVRVVRFGLLGRRVHTAYGRATQVGCLPAQPVCDGVRHPRAVSRWTWYRHTQDLRLVRGLR
jgi:hypothetical protein